MNSLLSAAARLGDVFARSPIVARYSSELSTARRIDTTDRHHRLISMFITSGPFFEAQPLLFDWYLRRMPQRAQLARLQEAAPLLAAASRVSQAHLTTIEWLRSWLPGYPFRLRLVHVDPYAPRVRRGGFPDSRLPWALGLRRAGLQLEADASDQVAAQLELPPAELRPSLLELRSELWRSAEWDEFSASRTVLADRDNDVLDTIVRDFRAGVRVIEATQIRRLMSFNANVEHLLRIAERQASENARTANYYKAFRDIDRLFETLGALISIHAIRREMASFTPERGVWFADEERQVRVSVANHHFFPHINDICQIDSELEPLRRLIRVEGLSMSWDSSKGELLDINGTTIDSGASADLAVRDGTLDATVLDSLVRSTS